MPTFDMGMETNDITEPKLMPEDWYNCELSKDPERVMNKDLEKIVKGGMSEKEALKVKESEEGEVKPGYNLLLTLRSVDCAEEYKNRPFWVRLGFPSPSDEGRFVGGQDRKSWKAQRMAKVVAALLGFDDWKKVPKKYNLIEGMKAQWYVTQGVGLDGQTPINEVDSLNVYPRPISGKGGKGGAAF